MLLVFLGIYFNILFRKTANYKVYCSFKSWSTCSYWC